MKGLKIDKYGNIAAMILSKDLPIPKLTKKTDILVDIYAASINPIDWKLRDGLAKMILPYNLPLVLGHDISGVVTDVGEDVTMFKKGDEVYSRLPDGRIGAYAEQCVVEEQYVSLKPKNISHVEAASLPLVAMTVIDAFEGSNLVKDSKVVITGGAGGVGTFAIQYAAHVLDLHVITTASEKKIDLCKSLGAKEVINYKTQDIVKEVKGVDYAFDTTGEADKMFCSVVKTKGKIVSIDGIPTSEVVAAKIKEGFQIMTGTSTLLDALQAKMNFKSWYYTVDYKYVFMQPSGKKLEDIKGWVEDGKIKPVIDKVFDLNNYVDAFKYAESGRATGKVCIEIRKSQ